MFATYSNLCSPSFCYLINYEIQSKMYDWFDDVTEERMQLKLPGFGMLCVSNIITTITRVTAIAETFFDGSCILLSAPFTDNRLVNIKNGLHEILVHSPKNVLRTIFIPVEFTVGAVFNFAEPKYFTIWMSECMKVNLKHARAFTINTESHNSDLAYTSGISYGRLLKYQKVTL